MKVTNTRGDWIGLAYWKGCSYRIDYFSSPDGWNFGFEVVYRLIFYTSDTDVIEKFRIAFRKAFGLSEDRYDVEQVLGVGNSVFWRVYWDRKGFELNMLEKCENKLNEVAEGSGTKVVVVEMAIIPRSLDYINQSVEANRKTNVPLVE